MIRATINLERLATAIEVCETAMVPPNIPVETQNFGENEDEDHADKDPRLAHERAHALAGVSHRLCRTTHDVRTASPTIPIA
jgi:hypothetical protein